MVLRCCCLQTGAKIEENHLSNLNRVRPKPRFPEIDKAVYEQFKAFRQKRRGVTGPMMQRWARRVAARLNINDFKGSSKWVHNFCLRMALSVRRPTNAKSQSFDERKTKCFKYLQSLRAVLLQHRGKSWNEAVSDDEKTTEWRALNTTAEGVSPREGRAYGRIAPHRRLNVDQVPLPFVTINATYTYASTGSKRVAIAQPGGGKFSKRMCTLQLCFRGAGQVQPRPALIFRGMGGNTKAKLTELKSYHKGVDVYWQVPVDNAVLML